MVFRSYGKNGIWVALLLSTTWAILATSNGWHGLEYGSFHEASDCVQPPLEADVVISSGQITSPGGMAHTDFGFPNATVEAGATNAGMVGPISRECRFTYGDQGGFGSENSYIFSCYDDGQYSCSIVLTEY